MKKQSSTIHPTAERGPHGSLSRRHVLAGGTAIGLSTLWPIGRARAAQALTLRLDWTTSGLHAPFYVAMDRGWFKKYGVDLKMDDGNGSSGTVQLVGSRQYDVGFAAIAPMAVARAKGLSVISIAGFLRKGDTGIIVPAEKHWTKPSDLANKKVGYTANSLEGPFVTSFFARNGVPESQLQLVNTDLSTKMTVYLSGQVDAMISTVPGYLPSVTDKRPSSGILFADFGLNLPGYGLLVNQSTLKAKRETLSRFASIICGAWTYVLAGHQDEAAKIILAKRPDTIYSLPVMVQQILAFKPFFYTEATKNLPIGIQAASDWKGTIQGMEVANVIPAGSKPADYFTNDLIDRDLVAKLATGVA